MSAVTYMRTFFKQLAEFVGQLEEMFPDDPDFAVFQTFLGLVQRTNPQMILATIQEHVVNKYETQIASRDEAFILTYDSKDYDSDVMNIVSKLRTYWKTLTEPSKNAMWQYLHVLTQLCKRYYAEVESKNK
jgi:hypothetical protein